MKYNALQLTSRKKSRRVGRGIAAGQGKTAGRGTKGQNARAGHTRRPGFEGGQNPLMQRLPKLRGFRSIRPKDEVVYTGQIDQLPGSIVDSFSLAKDGLITTPHTSVKLLLKGTITKKVQVKLQAASAEAIAAVQKAGGSFEKVALIARPGAKKANTKS